VIPPLSGTRPVSRALSSPASLTLITVLLVWGVVAPDYLVFLTSAAVPATMNTPATHAAITP
jgi:hypothetical protein